MAEIGRWGGQKFEVVSGRVQGFSGLTVKGGSETEDKESGGEKYVSRKSGKPTEVSLTVHLNAMTGCRDVRETAMWFVDAAQKGVKDYFYVANSKLVTCQLMLMEADVKEIQMTNNGTWIRCDIALTMKQCTKGDGSTSSGTKTSGSGGGSTKTAYKVQIPGMSVVTVNATSVQGAITAACGATWTGTVYVNGKSYYVVNGKISTNQSPSTSNKTITNNTKKDQASAVDAQVSANNAMVNEAKKTSATQKKVKQTTTTAAKKPSLTTNRTTAAMN